MSMIQVRNVPDDLHRRLKIRAAREGITLSELVLNELEWSIDFPTPRELDERFAAQEPNPEVPGESIAESVRAERDSR
jgi:hypothetical protein